jgi:hypothetical protein
MQPTYGENRVRSLLENLPNRRHFFWKAEPRLNHQRTARLQPDFVVVGARLGVLVLEVKDWVEILEVTQDRVIVRRRDGTQMEQENPVRAARDYAHVLMDMLKARAELLHQNGRHQGKLTFPVSYTVILPNLPQAIIQQGIESNIWREGEVIGREALSSPEVFEEALTNVKMPFRLQGAISPSALDVIRGVIDPKLVVKDSQNRDIGTISLAQERIIEEVPKSLDLTDSGVPRDVADVLEEALQPDLDVRMMRGVAGSGKTLVLIERARRLIEQYPDKRILVVTFNRNLAESLRAKIDRPAVKTLDFHQLCFEIVGWVDYQTNERVVSWLKLNEAEALEALNLPAEFVAAEIEYRKDMSLWKDEAYLRVERKGRERPLGAEARQIINGIFQRYRAYQTAEDFWDWADAPHKALAALQNGHPLRHAYDAILIDEAQDFAPSWIAVIKAVIKPHGHLFMCEDPSQSIFRLHSWQERGISIVGRTRLLTVPYRSTRAIAEVAHRLLENDPFVQDRVQPDLRTYALTAGDPPELAQFSSLQEEASYAHKVITQVTAQGIPSDQIAVLLPHKRLETFHTAIQKRGIRLLTFRTMKGLEFRVVIVPHLHTLFEGADEAAVSKAKRLLFTAMTRAREQLYLSFAGEMPEPLKALGLTPKTPDQGAVAQSAG